MRIYFTNGGVSMSKTKGRLLIAFVVVIVLFYSFASICVIGSNHISGVFHHTSSHDECIEVGSIVLQCKKDPEISIIHKKEINNNQEETLFLIKNCCLDSRDCITKIRSIEKNNDQRYQTQINNAPNKKDLYVRMTYDRDTYMISCDTYYSIRLQPSMVFRVYNKKLLKKLEKRDDPLLRLAHNDPPRIMIDCGHGGADAGAISPSGIKEKNLVLSLGLLLAQKLNDRGYKIFFTSDDDTFVSLDKRTTLAHNNKVDAFISLHANSAVNQQARGIETFCTQAKLFDQVDTQLSYDQKISLNALKKKRYKLNDSLATLIQQSLISSAATMQHNVNDRGVKYAAPQVLVGAMIPAVLVEVGFLSNMQEENFLLNIEYQKNLITSLSSSLDQYIKTLLK
jgi:N-acetylmuramoyl-L-alanine amidase